MSSEAITRNDLKAVLDEVLPAEPSEYKKLLWTNPSNSALSATTINLPVSDYDIIEIWISAQGESVPYPFYLDAKATYSGNIQVPRSELLGIRDVSNTSTSITFGSGKFYPSYGNWQSTTTQDSVCVPKKIYGVKYERIAPPQTNILDRQTVENIGGGGVLERSGNTVILHYPNANFVPSGTSVPVGWRPLLSNVWASVSASTDYTNQYRLTVQSDGAIVLQKAGANVTTTTSIRGQLVWII